MKKRLDFWKFFFNFLKILSLIFNFFAARGVRGWGKHVKTNTNMKTNKENNKNTHKNNRNTQKQQPVVKQN